MALREAPPALPAATVSEVDGVRYLHLDTPWVQGAMRIRKPQAIELAYVQRMLGWLLLREPATVHEAHAVQLGLGAATLTRFTHGVLGMRTTAVEINPAVIGACRAWFHLPDNDDRLRVVQGDAAAYVGDAAHAGSADALCVDLYDHEAAAPVLDDETFYRGCHALLAAGGVMSVNLFGRMASFERSLLRIARVFGVMRVAAFSPTREGNSIVLAWKGFDWPDRHTLALRAASVETRFKLPARKWLRLFASYPSTP
jgi:spermidine synthase